MQVLVRTRHMVGSVAVLLTLGLVAACNGNDVLGPPDSSACTVGSLHAGDSVESKISSKSCTVVSDYYGSEANAESWTLSAKAHTAYVVWVYHTADTTAFDNWHGALLLYSRNQAGDAGFATAWWNNFGTTNSNGGADEELIFTTTKDQTVSIRVEAASASDTGHYAIVVHSCAAPAIAAGDTSAVVAVDSSCATQSIFGAAHTAFWTLTGDTTQTTTVQFTKTAGTGWFYPVISGPDLDVGCYSDFCTDVGVNKVLTDTTYSPVFDVNGTYTAHVSVHADSSASMTVHVTSLPLVAPRPPMTRPAPAGRHR